MKADLESEISLLRAELAKKELELSSLRDKLGRYKTLEADMENERRALLYMLEDLNESSLKISMAKKEWMGTFDSIADPIFIHNDKFKIMKTNIAYQKMARLPFRDIIGQPYYHIFPKLGAPHNLCYKEPELKEVEEELEMPEIDRIFKIKSYPLKNHPDAEERYFIHVMEDITEVKRAYQNVTKEVEVNTHLLMIAEATALLTDMNQLMDRVLHCVSTILKNDTSLSYLWDSDAKVFRPLRAYNLDRNKIASFRTETLDKGAAYIRRAIKLKEPFIIRKPFQATLQNENAGLPSEVLEWTGEVDTAVFIPLKGKDNILGLMICLFKNPVEFTERERKVMCGLSHQISLALEQARLYRSLMEKTITLSHKIETIQIMHEIDSTILSTLEPQDILETAVRMIGKLIPCDRAVIAIVDREHQGFVYTAGYGVSAIQKGVFIKFSETSTKEVLDKGIPQYIPNLADTESPLFLEKRLIEDGFLSHIRVPLVVNNEITGILIIGSKRVAAFTPADLSTLEGLASQISIALDKSRLVSDLEDLFIGVVKALSSAIDAKSAWTAGHSLRVQRCAIDIGKKMGMSEEDLKTMELAALLHDIGKIGTYENILDKPGKLTGEELKIMQSHPAKGAEILSPIRLLKDIIPAIRSHHEHYDGTGYPDGLKGDEIPNLARIMAVADTVDAMSAERPYRKGRSMDVIIGELKRCSGKQFDPAVVDAFLQVTGQQPHISSPSLY